MRRVLVLVLVAVLAAGACSKDKAGRDHGVITKAGSISVFDLRPGDCLEPDDDLSGDVEKINAVPCADPHTHEVFGVPEYPDDGGVYPGEAKIKEFADASCLEAFSEYTGTDYLDSDLFFSYLLPTIDSWNSGDDRQVTCVIVATGNEMTGSVKGTTTTTAKGSKSTTSTSVKKTTTTTSTTAAP
jgi:hypothetical protein